MQGLEGRVKELERQLSDLRAISASPAGNADPDDEVVSGERRRPRDSVPSAAAWDQQAMMQQGMQPQPQPHAPSPSLAEELRALSLEATAERHLGSSSGVSFAKLTQTVLRRLTPDKADFIFENVLEDSLDEAGAHTSPGGLLATAFSQLPGSPAPFPQPLFGHIALSDITDTDVSLAALPLPHEAHMRHLIDFYFAHTHTLYPIVPRAEFSEVVACIRADPTGPLAQSPLSRFRLWMVLAIGSTTYSSVTLTEESESVLYYSKALEYLEDALGYGDLVRRRFLNPCTVGAVFLLTHRPAGSARGHHAPGLLLLLQPIGTE